MRKRLTALGLAALTALAGCTTYAPRFNPQTGRYEGEQKVDDPGRTVQTIGAINGGLLGWTLQAMGSHTSKEQQRQINEQRMYGTQRQIDSARGYQRPFSQSPIQIIDTWVEEEVVENGRNGFNLYVHFKADDPTLTEFYVGGHLSIIKRVGQPDGRLESRGNEVYWDGDLISILKDKDGKFSTTDGSVGWVSGPFFMPYDQLHIDSPGKHTIGITTWIRDSPDIEKAIVQGQGKFRRFVYNN
jgi:hypothetical protein